MVNNSLADRVGIGNRFQQQGGILGALSTGLASLSQGRRLDKRLIFLELETPDGKKRYDGISVEYSITKTGGAGMNEAEIRVANLAKDVRNYLITATSPLTKPRRRKTIAIYAGYESTGVTRRFVGDVTSASPTQPPDIWLTMKARTAFHAKGAILARSSPEYVNLSALAKWVAGDLGLSLEFQAQDKTLANYSFTGPALEQVDKLADVGFVDAFIDDDRLIVKDRGAPLAGRRRVLSMETGMIGLPEITERGVRATMLLDPHTTIGTELVLESKVNPAANGMYTVYSLRENCALRSPQFYIEVEATRRGLGGMVK